AITARVSRAPFAARAPRAAQAPASRPSPRLCYVSCNRWPPIAAQRWPTNNQSGRRTMRKGLVVALSLGCLTFGIGVGCAAKEKLPGMDAIRGKPAKEAAQSALETAEKIAGEDSWQLIAIARVYYLSGDKAHGQAIIDRVNAAKNTKGGDWQRIGRI